jgi:type 1 glutamine amidotransferase
LNLFFRPLKGRPDSGWLIGVLSIPFSLAGSGQAFAQPMKILHYSETSGFDHQTRAVSIAMFQQLGSQYGFTVDHDSTGDAFSTAAGLQLYAAVVFSNTTGDAILDPAQRLNFESYMNAGGNLLGIHSATDTYRHSSANGSSTGTWDFFAETLGGSVQQNPSHVTGTPFYPVYKTAFHPATANLPDPWLKPEEYYYWDSGYLHPGIYILQKVEETVGPNNMVNSYDSSRAVSWVNVPAGGGKVFYTSLGHAASNFTADSLFRTLIRDALLWMLGMTGAPSFSGEANVAFAFPNPWLVNGTLEVFLKTRQLAEITLEDLSTGILFRKIGTSSFIISLTEMGLRPGLYIIRCHSAESNLSKKLILLSGDRH